MKTKLSNTSVNLYNQCSLCYKLHYINNIRPVKTSSALVFGSSLDSALNELLLTKDVNLAHSKFEESWYGFANDGNITYFKNDLDIELLDYFGLDAIFTDSNWNSMRIKGQLFIDAYYKEVLPRIKKVIAVQEPISIKNLEGDEVPGFLDFIAEWEDGKTYVMDNKSSASLYAPFSVKDGQQLPLYHYAVKHKYKLDGGGYIVLIKKINKNKVKVCKICKMINNSSHKKCPEILPASLQYSPVRKDARCNGEFQTTINPSVDIQYVFNKIEESDENRVLELFDQTNHAISNNEFALEHSPVRGKYGWCPYKEYEYGSPDFYVKEKK